MAEKKARQKPVGTTGSIQFGPEGVVRHCVEFPKTKDEIELFVANGFCNPGRVSYLPHLKRYSQFIDLRQQQENSLDFQVSTGLGKRWLELCEFAPLEHLGGRYELVSDEWDASFMLELFIKLVEKKGLKSDGKNVILLIYKTHETLFVPPTILRAARRKLLDRPPPFESIYYISPYSSTDMGVWEVWPGEDGDPSWEITRGKLLIGL